ncbi:MAG: hypothetical protein CMJ59_00355 [Planctomycetaceae bacterium]|nr:hypothetical protein [Planctomycetaceae bacterium]
MFPGGGMPPAVCLAACAGALLASAAAAADVLIYDRAPAADAAWFPGTSVTDEQQTPLGPRRLLEVAGYVRATHPQLQDLYDAEVTALVRAAEIDQQSDYNFRGVGIAARYQPYRHMAENWLYFQTFDRALAEKEWDQGSGCVSTAHFGTDFKLAFVDSRMYRTGATELRAQTGSAPGLETGKWYYYKLRLEGDDQRAKVWCAGTPEPNFQVIFQGVESAPGSVGFRALGGTRIEIAHLKVTWLGTTPSPGPVGVTGRRIERLRGRLASLRQHLARSESTISLATTPDHFTAHYRMKHRTEEVARRLARAQVLPIAGDLTRATEALEEAEGMRRRLTRGEDPYRGVTGLMDRAYRSEIDGALQPYALYVPPAYRADRAWPMIVMLHGTSGNTRIQMLHAGLQAPGRVFPYIVIGPGGRGSSTGYDRLGELDVWDAMASVQSAYRIDTNRVYLTGLSLGGDGVVLLSYLHPDRFAAVAPFGIGFGQWRAPNFHALPIRFGLTDQEGVKTASEYRQLLAAEGLPHAETVVYKRVSHPETATFGQKPAHFHASTVPDYRLGRVFEFFTRHRRDPWPKKVAYEQLPNRLGRYYWFEVNQVTLLRGKWRVEAEIKDGNEIRLRTWHVAEMKLFLNEHLVDMTNGVRVMNNDQLVYQGPAKEVVELTLAEPPGTALWKGRPGTFGSFGDFFYHPVIYAYGTAGSDQDTALLAAEAAIAASWEGQAFVDFPLLPEEEVTREMMNTHNVVLFGTPAASALVRRMLPAIPLTVSEDAVTVAGERHAGDSVGVKLLYPNPLAPGRMVQLVTGTGLAALKDSAVVGEYAAKAYYKQAWLGEDFIVFDDKVKAFQRAVRTDRRHPARHYVKFGQEVRRLLLDYGVFAIDWLEIDARKGAPTPP